MKTILLRLAGLCLLLAASISTAAINNSRFTDKELAQGFSDTSVIVKPRSDRLATIDADETSEGLVLHRKFSRFGDIRVLRVPAGDTSSHTIERLRATGRYEYVEPDRILHELVTPNDPSFSKQWSLANSGQNGGAFGADISAVTGWDTLHDAADIIVAIVDSGMRLTHEDLAGNLWSNTDGTHGIAAVSGNGTTISDPTDTDNGHGTHVAGIIGAVGNNGVGISGIAWKVQLMPLRFLHGTEGGMTSDELVCLQYAIDHHAKIINASYGQSSFVNSELAALTAVRNAGIIFVAAAGNGTDDNGTAVSNDSLPSYPANYELDNIVSVAATDNKDTLAVYSNYGSGLVDLAAPGGDGAANSPGGIYSAWIGSDSDYQIASGTSMAAPHVTGALALLMEKFPNDTYRQLINRLLRGTTKLSALSGKVQSGGRLNLAQALTSTDNRPFNDDFADRAVLSGANVHVRTNNTDATAETDLRFSEPTHAGFAASHSLWWSWKAPDTTQVFFDTAGSSYDTLLEIYTGSSISGLTSVGSNDNFGSLTTSRVVLNVTAGTTYVIAVDGKSATGYTSLKIGSVPANDNFASAKTLTGIGIRETGTTLNASKESGEPNPTARGIGHSVWYKWVAPASGHFSLAAFSKTTDTVAAIYTGSSVSSLTTVASNDNNANSSNSDALVSFNATASSTYYLQVDNTANSSNPDGGDFTLTLTDSVWEFPANDEVTASPAVGSDGTVYFGAGAALDQADDTNVYAVTSGGIKKWSFTTTTTELGIIGASPALGADGTVYIGSTDKSLYALNGSTGAKKWSYAGTSAIYSTAALAANGTVYYRDDTTLYALDGNSNGALKWTFTLNTAAAAGTYCSPVIAADGTIYVGTTGGTFYALTDNGSSAAVKWTYTASGDIYTSPTLASDGTIYFGTLAGNFYALTPGGSSAVKKWSILLPQYNGTDNSITSSPALAGDGTIYFAAYDHKLYALNPTTGATKWSYTLGDQVRASSPAVANDGTIYIGAYDGSVYAVNSDGTLQRTYPTALQIRSSPVIANNRLYFGSADGKLHAFDLAKSPAASSWAMFHQNAARTGRASSGLAIASQPQSKTVAVGTAFSLSVTVTASGSVTYQWYKDGNAISGATTATYSVASATNADAGSYTVVVSSSSDSVTSTAATVTVVAAGTSGTTLANIATRAFCSTGNNVTIGGFVITGSTAKRVLIRAVGPSLVDQGLSASEILADPTVEVHQGSAVIATNDNWSDNANAGEITSVSAQIGAVALSSNDTKSSALLLSLQPGVYSFITSGKGSTSGIVLLEVYDADVGIGSSLVNIASRADCTTGNGVAIGGFVISGSVSKQVLIRAVGPTLTTQGIGQTEVLADPSIELHSGSAVIATNDDWGTNANAAAIVTTGARIGATPFANTDTKSSALLLTLSPGVYSFISSGKGGTSGIVLVEVYDAD